MVMLRDYKLFHFHCSYDHDRIEHGGGAVDHADGPDAVETKTYHESFEVHVVAANEEIARAVLNTKHNAYPNTCTRNFVAMLQGAPERAPLVMSRLPGDGDSGRSLFRFRMTYNCDRAYHHDFGPVDVEMRHYDTDEIVTCVAQSQEIAEAMIRTRSGGPSVQGYNDYKLTRIDVPSGPHPLLLLAVDEWTA